MHFVVASAVACVARRFVRHLHTAVVSAQASRDPSWARSRDCRLSYDKYCFECLRTCVAFVSYDVAGLQHRTSLQLLSSVPSAVAVRDSQKR